MFKVKNSFSVATLAFFLFQGTLVYGGDSDLDQENGEGLKNKRFHSIGSQVKDKADVEESQSKRRCIDVDPSSENGSLRAVNTQNQSAEQEEAREQYNLGVMYEQGQGVEQSDIEAVKLYRLAADQGDAYAQCYLGNMYDGGRGVEQNFEEAVKWYRLAADQGNAHAQCNLGTMYDGGQGVEQSDIEAVKLYRLAADQGNAEAQSNLGFMYREGRGVEQNDIEAAKLYRLAAEQGDAGAQCNLGFMYRKGQGVEQSDIEAAKLYRLAADQGNAPAQFKLGTMYFYGRGVEQSYEKAREFYQKAVDGGLERARDSLNRVTAILRNPDIQEFFSEQSVHTSGATSLTKDTFSSVVRTYILEKESSPLVLKETQTGKELDREKNLEIIDGWWAARGKTLEEAANTEDERAKVERISYVIDLITERKTVPAPFYAHYYPEYQLTVEGVRLCIVDLLALSIIAAEDRDPSKAAAMPEGGNALEDHDIADRMRDLMKVLYEVGTTNAEDYESGPIACSSGCPTQLANYLEFTIHGRGVVSAEKQDHIRRMKALSVIERSFNKLEAGQRTAIKEAWTTNNYTFEGVESNIIELREGWKQTAVAQFKEDYASETDAQAFEELFKHAMWEVMKEELQPNVEEVDS